MKNIQIFVRNLIYFWPDKTHRKDKHQIDWCMFSKQKRKIHNNSNDSIFAHCVILMLILIFVYKTYNSV